VVRAPWRGRSRFELTGWVVLTIVIGALMAWPWLRVIDDDDEAGASEPIAAEGDDAGATRPAGDGDQTPGGDELPGGDEPPGGTTTTVDNEFESEEYAVGECLDWDPTDPYQATDTVDCSEPHRMEVVGDVDLSDHDDFPTDEEWAQLTVDRCTPLADDFLGRPFDPDGRFTLYTLAPVADGWHVSDHTLVCGLAGRPGSTDGGVLAGRAVDLDPSFHQSVGSCWADNGEGLVAVGCEAPHHYEVVGPIEVRQDDDDYPTSTEWVAVFDACAGPVEAYTGETVTREVGDLSADARVISEASWAAGARSTDCWVSRRNSFGEPAELTGSLAADAASSTTGSATVPTTSEAPAEPA
jgi:hypothetical protein